MGRNAPCYKCETQYEGCHSKCVKYIDYTQKLAVENEKIRTAKIVDRLNYNARNHYPTRTLRQKNAKNKWIGGDTE